MPSDIASLHTQSTQQKGKSTEESGKEGNVGMLVEVCFCVRHLFEILSTEQQDEVWCCMVNPNR